MPLGIAFPRTAIAFAARAFGATAMSVGARRRRAGRAVAGLFVLGTLTQVGFFAAGLFVPGCGKDKSPVQPSAPLVPASWAGIWEFNGQEFVCGQNDTLIVAPAFFDTICAGRPVDEEIDFQRYSDIQCPGTYTISDTVVTFTCGGTFTVGSGCTDTFLATGTGLLNRRTNKIAATLRLNTDYQPDGCYSGDTDNCYEYRLQGVRVAVAPASCTPSKLGLLGKLRASLPRR